MDGENNGKPYFLMDDLGVPLFSETSISNATNRYVSVDLSQFWGKGSREMPRPQDLVKTQKNQEQKGYTPNSLI